MLLLFRTIIVFTSLIAFGCTTREAPGPVLEPAQPPTTTSEPPMDLLPPRGRSAERTKHIKS